MIVTELIAALIQYIGYNQSFQNCYSLILVSVIFLYLFKLGGDVEENLEPKPSSDETFSICHWNLNSISAHNYIKLSLLRAYVSTHKFDAICISETYLGSDTFTIDENLEIVGYTLITPISKWARDILATSVFCWIFIAM